MKKMNVKEWKKALLFCLLFAVPMVSCDNDPEIDPETETKGGYYVLNEGLWKGNNGSIGIYDLDTKTYKSDAFKSKNGRALGDTSQDILVYGGKIYITVYGSGVIEVTDLALNSIKQIKAEEGAEPLQPRYLTAHNGKVYVSLYDGYVAAIDTTALAIEKKTKVGDNPEQLVVSNNKLYVPNSGGMNEYPSPYGNSVSVLSLPALVETKTIEVGYNPCWMQVGKNGMVWLVSVDYGNTLLQRINPANDEVKAIGPATQIAVGNKNVYIMQSEYDEAYNPTYTYHLYDTAADKLTDGSLFTDGTTLSNPYKLGSIPSEELFYVTESDYVNTGDVYLVDMEGKVQHTFEAALGPVKVVRIP